MFEQQTIPAQGFFRMPILPAKLSLNSKFLIFSLFIISFQLLEYVPFSLGPITLTNVLELCLVGLFWRDIVIYLRKRHPRQTMFLVLVSVMTVQMFITFRPDFALARLKMASVSLLFYLLTIVAFHHDVRSTPWVKRLHLILAWGVIFLFFAQSDLISLGDTLSLSERLGGNFPPAYLAMLLPICWVQAQRERGIYRWLNLLTIVGAFGIEILSASRGGFICLVAALVFVALWLKKGKGAIVFLLVTIAISSSMLSTLDLAVLKRVSSLATPELAIEGRSDLMKAAVLFIERHPLFGGDFRAVVFSYLLEVSPDSRIGQGIVDGFWDTQSGPHNGYLNAMAEHGIPLGLLFIGYFLWLYRDLFRSSRFVANREDRELLRAACISVLVFAIFMLADHAYWAVSYFVLAATMECYVSLFVRMQAWSRYQNPGAMFSERSRCT